MVDMEGVSCNIHISIADDSEDNLEIRQVPTVLGKLKEELKQHEYDFEQLDMYYINDADNWAELRSDEEYTRALEASNAQCLHLRATQKIPTASSIRFNNANWTCNECCAINQENNICFICEYPRE